MIGGDIHDLATGTLFDENGHHRPAKQELTLEIGADNTAIVIDGLFEAVSCSTAGPDAGIVDQDVYPAEGFTGAINNRSDVTRVSHITLPAHRLHAQGFELIDNVAQLIADITKREVYPGPCQRSGIGPPESDRRTGNYGRLVFKQSHR